MATLDRRAADLPRIAAAAKIQRAFRRAITDPARRMCRDRLMREFDSLSENV